MTAETGRRGTNPSLADIKAVMTDNNIDFDSGNTGDTGWGIQVQPVYALDYPDRGFTLIPRAVIPIIGVEPGTDRPNIGQPDPSATYPKTFLSPASLPITGARTISTL